MNAMRLIEIKIYLISSLKVRLHDLLNLAQQDLSLAMVGLDWSSVNMAAVYNTLIVHKQWGNFTIAMLTAKNISNHAPFSISHCLLPIFLVIIPLA
jgi:hypothetical protein